MKKTIAAAALALALTACAGDGTGNVEYSEDRGENGIIPDTTAYVKEITVGTHQCIIFRDGDMGGIWCENGEELE